MLPTRFVSDSLNHRCLVSIFPISEARCLLTEPVILFPVVAQYLNVEYSLV